MAIAGPTRITYYINRADQCGWQMIFYTSNADLAAAETQSSNLRTQVAACLATDTNIVGARYTDTNNPRKSVLRRLNMDVNKSSGEILPDERTVCASFNLLNTNGQKEVRSVRGLPDDWVAWSIVPHRMILSPDAIAVITLLRQELCNSAQQTYGWLPRLRKNEAGSATSLITALGANAFGNAVLTIADTTPFKTNPLGPIIVGGMRGMQKFLNGTYLPSAYVIINNTSIGLVNRQTGAGVITSYSGQATVRLANPQFVAYQRNQALPPPGGIEISTVASRDTGRPFFLTHGRQGK
jgi:hypothetical protein